MRAGTWVFALLLVILLFPFLFGGTFIEGVANIPGDLTILVHFPSFSEGLSLRATRSVASVGRSVISLPFRRDFH